MLGRSSARVRTNHVARFALFDRRSPSHGFSASTERGGVATVSQNSAFHLTSGGTITYACANAPLGTRDAGATMQYANMRVTAIQVGALH